MKTCCVHRYRRRSCSVGPGSAQFAKAEDATNTAKAAFFRDGQHFGRIALHGQRQSLPFDAKAAQESADIVAVMSKRPGKPLARAPIKGAPHSAHSPADLGLSKAKYKEHADKLQAEAN